MKKPKYQVIKDALRQEIISDKFKNGDRFYTESELTKKFSSSSITVIRALNELAKDGYLVRIQGKGTFVSRARKNQSIEFSDIETFPINHESTKVINITRDNDPIILDKLRLSATDHYYLIERLRYNLTEAYLYQKSYIPENYINKDYSHDSYYNSIYSRFLDDFNIYMPNQPFEEINEVVFPAPNQVQQKLEIDENIPCIRQTRQTFKGKENELLEYIESYKKWNYFKIKIESSHQ